MKEFEFYLGAGSIWVILRSVKLDAKDLEMISSKLEGWIKALRQLRSAWRFARLQAVPQAAVPAGLLKMVRQLRGLARGRCVVLTADNVRELVAERLSRAEQLSSARLHVFEGQQCARGWLRQGDLRFVLAEDWQAVVQNLPSNLRDCLEKLATEKIGRKPWEHSPEFQAGAFLLHRLVTTDALAGAAVDEAVKAKSPGQFLSWVLARQIGQVTSS
ncbi:unnamed protein product [Effrenium voratum]|uniref:Uncharacterized protein n=1 Tax=Effrenium voratum TaxID=2562239 RepID=A0AA36IY82_9DINO|nr:unnamed protein product [Effrenium voratum]CAJ1451118.1 unnamed protein product [Effrenium voratum]